MSFHFFYNYPNALQFLPPSPNTVFSDSKYRGRYLNNNAPCRAVCGSVCQSIASSHFLGTPSYLSDTQVTCQTLKLPVRHAKLPLQHLKWPLSCNQWPLWCLKRPLSLPKWLLRHFNGLPKRFQWATRCLMSPLRHIRWPPRSLEGPLRHVNCQVAAKAPKVICLTAKRSL